MNMPDKNRIPPLDEVLLPALREAFLKAAEEAKQTHTALVVWQDNKIVHIPYNKIDQFVKKQIKNVFMPPKDF